MPPSATPGEQRKNACCSNVHFQFFSTSRKQEKKATERQRCSRERGKEALATHSRKTTAGQQRGSQTDNGRDNFCANRCLKTDCRVRRNSAWGRRGHDFFRQVWIHSSFPGLCTAQRSTESFRPEPRVLPPAPATHPDGPGSAALRAPGRRVHRIPRARAQRPPRPQRGRGREVPGPRASLPPRLYLGRGRSGGGGAGAGAPRR